MRLRLTLILTGLATVFGLLWAMWPSPISPAYWDEPEPPAMTGPLAPNAALTGVDIHALGMPGTGEGVAVSDRGEVYFGTVDGRIERLVRAPGGATSAGETVARITHTQILGLDWLRPGVLGVAAISGLYALDVETGTTTLISTGAPAHPFGYVNDLAALPDGRIYFTDSSTRWGHSSNNAGYVYDMMENRPSGALYVWDPATHQTRLVRSRLHYPNGVALASDGRSLLVVESFRYRILRVWIDGPDAGDIDVFADNLPGIPDGIMADGEGRLFLAMPSRRSPLLAFLHRSPRLTQFVMKLPDWMRPDDGDPHGFVLVMEETTGEALTSWHNPEGRHCYLSNLDIAPDDSLWIGSTDCGQVVRFDMPRLPAPRNEGAGERPLSAR